MSASCRRVIFSLFQDLLLELNDGSFDEPSANELTINAQLQDLEDENYTEDAVEANSFTSNQNRTKKQVMEEDRPREAV